MMNMSRAPSPRSRLLIMWTFLVVTGLFTISYSWDYGLVLSSSIYVNLIALIILFIGISIRIVALIEIRNAFRIDKLVTSGIYSKTRNPTYLGFIFIIIGISIASLAILSFIWVILSIVTFYYVAKKEEKDLEETFGEDYLKYEKSVPLFIPKLNK
jgi:methanethiol S-methyltransferase